jgi:sterol desaturase/sphingolipid hydroxylase (fatty acid hydroxylase superfamily)
VFGTFFRHGATAALAVCALALLGTIVFGLAPFHPLDVVIGALLFYGSEYLMHRFAFHAPPARNAFVRRLQHRLHYDHHVEPDRLDLLFLPLWFLVPNLALTAALVALVLGLAATASTMLGVVAAILHYEWTHYVAHTPIRPLTALGRWIKQYHLRHHYISEKLWFGVSNPSLDLVFGTYRRLGEARRSATVRSLHPER